MDIFNQNWNQQMKENPFVNKLLNNKRPGKPENILVTTRTKTRWNRSKKVKELLPYSKELKKSLNKERRENPKPKSIKQGIVGQSYIIGIKVIRKLPSYHTMTRPTSLYNLKYATQR
jgi:hypothetical protein